MSPAEQTENSVIALLSEFSTKLRDLEERQKIIKERILMIGKNFINEKEKSDKEIIEIKKSIEKSNQEIELIKRFLRGVSEEIDNFVRKEDFAILHRQFKMFQPMKLARIEDVKRMIKQALNKSKKNQEKTNKSKDIKTKKA